jgi:hypothetical protein
LIDDSSIWRTISDRWHHNFIETLKRRDSNSLSAALSKLHDLPLLKGIDQSESESRRFRDSPEARWRFLVDSKSLLCRLTEALGILELEVDPRYRAPENIYLPVREVVEGIQEGLGFDITPPAVGHGRFGLRVGPNSVMTNRDLYALYLAVRCRDIAAESGIGKGARILEIGGGMGRLAYYLHRLGHENVSLLDLPQISLVQAYFLRRSLGSAVRYGIEAKVGAGGAQVFSGGLAALEAHPPGSFDIVVNSDSMPEMGWSTARSYAAAVSRRCKGSFLSVNQEARKPIGERGATHAVVAKVLEDVGGFRRLYRFPFWLRNGYVEELYAIQGT